MPEVKKLDDVLRSFGPTKIRSGPSSTLALRSCRSCTTEFIVKIGDTDTVECDGCTIPVSALVGNPQSLSVRCCAKCKGTFAAGPEVEYAFECGGCVESGWSKSREFPARRATDSRNGVAVEAKEPYRCDQCASRYNSYSGLQNHKEAHRARPFPLSLSQKGDSFLRSTSTLGTPFPRSPVDKPIDRFNQLKIVTKKRPNRLLQVGGEGEGGGDLADFLHIGANEAPPIGPEAVAAKTVPSDPSMIPLGPHLASKATGHTTLIDAILPSVAAKEGSRAIDIRRVDSGGLLEAPILNQVDDDISKYGSSPSRASSFSAAYPSQVRSAADAAVSKYGFAPPRHVNFESGRVSSQASRSPSSTYFSAQSHLSWLTQSGDNSCTGVYSSNPFSKTSPRRRNAIERNSPPKSEFRKLIEAKGLRRDVVNELNWSGGLAGSGQHVEYNRGDKIPLERVGDIGQSLTAKVEKVRCKRIMLARKTITCTRRWKLSDAINEVEHLERIRHFHIVQLIGTYIVGREFSILLYPVANWDLKTFMNEIELDLERPYMIRSEETRRGLANRLQFLQYSFKCLIAALEVIHVNTTKHMDIKPLNVLVKQVRGKEDKNEGPPYYRVYVADFGISRNFSTQDHSQTAGPTLRSPVYCAPEVFNSDSRGRAADVFSIGCVFLEMATVLRGFRREDFAEFREAGNGDGDESFRMNLDRVVTWSNERLSSYPAHEDSVLRRTYDTDLGERLPAFLSMVSKNPDMRPTAAALKKALGTWSCCSRGPEPFEAEEGD